MNTQKHTPAPWRVERGNPSPTTGEWMIAGGIPGYLAEVRDCGSGDVSANARLIAAAPDLLIALQKIDSCAAESVEWIRRVTREAIYKATGETAWMGAGDEESEV